jgi:hypothetical protein
VDFLSTIVFYKISTVFSERTKHARDAGEIDEPMGTAIGHETHET